MSFQPHRHLTVFCAIMAIWSFTNATTWAQFSTGSMPIWEIVDGTTSYRMIPESDTSSGLQDQMNSEGQEGYRYRHPLDVGDPDTYSVYVRDNTASRTYSYAFDSYTYVTTADQCCNQMNQHGSTGYLFLYPMDPGANNVYVKDNTANRQFTYTYRQSTGNSTDTLTEMNQLGSQGYAWLTVLRFGNNSFHFYVKDTVNGSTYTYTKSGASTDVTQFLSKLNQQGQSGYFYLTSLGFSDGVYALFVKDNGAHLTYSYRVLSCPTGKISSLDQMTQQGAEEYEYMWPIGFGGGIYETYNMFVKVGTEFQPPAAPTGVSASDGTYTDKVRVTWTGVSGASFYEVWRNSVGSSDSASAILLGTSSGTTYDDPMTATYPFSLVYYYWVKATDGSHVSAFSISDTGYCGSTPPPNPPPSAPTGVSASDGTYMDRVRVTWNASSGATSYEVWRRSVDISGVTSPMMKISSPDPTGTSYDDTSVTADNGCVYVYWVKAVNAAGASEFGGPTFGWCASVPVIGPVIKANGLIYDITINNGANLSITVQLDPGQYAGVPVDWWVIARAGSSWFYMDRVAGWTQDGNLSHWHPVHQGPLVDLPATPVLNISGLGTGSYTFYFAVSYPMTGILNLNGVILVDSVDVIVQ